MTDRHRDFSLITTTSSSSSIDRNDILVKNTDFDSSLESYANLFNKDRHNFTASSEISFAQQDDEHPLSDNHNRTFTKEISKTIINAFTGKPISPNPWRKLCTKNIQQQTDTDVVIIPTGIYSPRSRSNDEKTHDKSSTSNVQLFCEESLIDPSNHRIRTRQSRKDIISHPKAMDSTDDEDQAFERFLEEHRTPNVIKQQPNTPVQRRRRKKNSLKDFINKSSSSSNEDVKEHQADTPIKINRFLRNDPTWRRLAEIYTSEDSDENNHLLSSNMNYTVRLKSEIYTSDQSSSSTSSTTDENKQISCNFLESLAERIPFEDKHPDAQPYFLQSAFNLKEKRQELANKLLFLFNRDVFSSQLSDRVSVVWSGRLTATAGHCTSRKTTRTAVITLSHKVCDSPERCRDTLLHEMCHAAVTLIDDVMEYGHGPLWQQWTRIAEQSYPYLPAISVRHTYDVNYKFIYRCIQCQHEVYRHSKSLNLEVDCCGKCMGRFDLIVNKNIEPRQTPKKAINKYNLYVKENFQLMRQANPHLSTPQLMKQLSREYKQKNQQQDIVELPDLDQLKL